MESDQANSSNSDFQLPRAREKLMKNKPKLTTLIVLNSPPLLSLEESNSKESCDKDVDKEEVPILKTPSLEPALEKPNFSNPLIPEQPNISSTPLIQPTFYRPPKKVKKEIVVSVKKS